MSDLANKIQLFDPIDFELSDEDIMETAFEVVSKITEGYKDMPKEFQEVILHNNKRVYWAVSSLLESTDFEKEYWKQ